MRKLLKRWLGIDDLEKRLEVLEDLSETKKTPAFTLKKPTKDEMPEITFDIPTIDHGKIDFGERPNLTLKALGEDEGGYFYALGHPGYFNLKGNK